MPRELIVFPDSEIFIHGYDDGEGGHHEKFN